MLRRSAALAAAGMLAAGTVGAGAVWAGVSGAPADPAAETHSGWPGARVLTAGSARSAATADIVVRAKETHSRFVDVGRKGESPGDLIVFNDRLLAAQSNRHVGRVAAQCAVGLGTFPCEGTIRIFGRGEIQVDGTALGPRDNVYAVTGGTRTFRGVGGQLEVFQPKRGLERLVVHLTR